MLLGDRFNLRFVRTVRLRIFILKMAAPMVPTKQKLSFIVFSVALLCYYCLVNCAHAENYDRTNGQTVTNDAPDFYSFSVSDSDRDSVDLNKYRGKVKICEKCLLPATRFYPSLKLYFTEII